jgi:hypothetical protein
MSAPPVGPTILAPDLEIEKRELDTLLASAAFTRAPNLHRFLKFIGSKYFEGKSEEIKEYTVAVHALKRPEDFDPRTDTIVRVTAMALRKRLEEYYASEGVTHPVHVELPLGQYVPRFVHHAVPPVVPPTPDPALDVVAPAAPAARPGRGRWITAIAVLVALLLAAFGIYRLTARPRTLLGGGGNGLPGTAGMGSRMIRFLPGDGRQPYTDATGETWQPDTFCTGGHSFDRTMPEVQGSDDPALFAQGREGRFECRVPAPDGTYEVHLYFAEAPGGKEATKQVIFRINGDAPVGLDVVSDAQGDQTATARVYPDVRPLADGTIHIDFISDDAFVNAIEVAPSKPGQPLPLRILAGRATYRDHAGNIWLPDRFFFGGRRTYRAEGLPAITDQALFRWERFGHFRYNLPVATGHDYAVSLYFLEAWFGVPHGGGSGGIGSRVFDVYCNGTTLLKDFDILREQTNGFVIKTFHHVRPTAQGKLELSFVPVANYPLVNAIEVVPEE